MDWTPAKYGKDRLVAKYGEPRTELLLQFLGLQMDGQLVPLGPLVREICKLGGMFGWEDPLELAYNLSTAIAHVRGQTFGGSFDPLAGVIEDLSFLGLPKHAVTSLPQDRMPVWETVER